MSRIVVLLIGLLVAVHVRLGPLPAPLPVFAALLGVLAVLLFLIWEAAHQGTPRRRKPVSLWARN